MRTHSMSIVLTAAVLSCFFIEIAGAQAVAPTLSMPASTAACNAFHASNSAPKPPSAEQLQAFYNKCMSSLARAEDKEKGETCAAAKKDFDKASSDFNGACKDAGSVLNAFAKALEPADETGSSQNNCLANVVRCEECVGLESASYGGRTYSCGKLEGNPEDEDDDKTSSALGAINGVTGSILGNTSATTSAAAAKRRASMEEEILECVPRSAEELKTLKGSVKESRADLRTAEEKALEKTTEMMTSNQEVEDKRNAARDRAEEIQTKAQAAIEKLKAQLDSRTQEAVSNWTQNNNNMETDIRRMERSKIQAEVAYTESILQLDRGCHANALARVETSRKEMMDLIKQNAYTAGGFNSLMSGTGDSNRKKFQKMADSFYKDCRNDRAYKSVVESSNRAKKFAIDTASEEIAALKVKQAQARKEIDTFKTSENTRVLTEMQRISTNMSQALAALDREVAAESKKAQQKLYAKGMELNAVNRRLEESKDDYQEDNDRMRLIRRLSKDRTPGKEGSVDAAISAFRQARNTARHAESQCCDITETTAESKRSCELARGFLGLNKANGAPELTPPPGKAAKGTN